MAMRVDQSGQENDFAEIVQLTTARFNFLEWPDCGDSIPLDRDRAIVDWRSGHRDDGVRAKGGHGLKR